MWGWRSNRPCMGRVHTWLWVPCRTRFSDDDATSCTFCKLDRIARIPSLSFARYWLTKLEKATRCDSRDPHSRFSRSNVFFSFSFRLQISRDSILFSILKRIANEKERVSYQSFFLYWVRCLEDFFYAWNVSRVTGKLIFIFFYNQIFFFNPSLAKV